MDFRRFLWIAVVLMVGAVTPLAAAGGGDVFGQIGFVSVGKDVGKHVLVGGGGSAVLGDKAAVFGELNYVPMGSASVRFGDFSASASANALQVGAGVRMFLPFERSIEDSRLRLYVPVAAGLLRLSASASYDDASMSASDTGGYFGFGFGSEIDLREKIGVRPEFRYTRWQVSGEGFNAISLSVGVFYRFGGR